MDRAFQAPARARSATQFQRLEIRHSMEVLELDTRRITLMHRLHFEAASLPCPEMGSDVDAVLCNLSINNASRLIQALRQAREGLQ